MKIVVTGSSGFLGGYIVERFKAEGHEVFPLPSFLCNLRNLEDTRSTFNTLKPDLLIHAAAKCGGIGFNARRQSDMLYSNVLINFQTLEAARLARIPRVLMISSSCAYPDLDRPAREDDLWTGLPHPSVKGYGMAKRLEELQGMLYQVENDINVTTVILPNLYGEKDHFGQRSHVVSALIQRFVRARNARDAEVIVWGTGRPIRELLYVRDAAEGILRVSRDYNCACEKPLNVGTGAGHTIANIAFIIMDAVGYQGHIVFDMNKPDGQMFKVMDVSRMREFLKWEPPTPLEVGIRKTVDWYISCNLEY